MSSAQQTRSNANESYSSAVGKSLKLPTFSTPVVNPVPDSILKVDFGIANGLPGLNVDVLNNFFDKLAVRAALRTVLEEVFSYVASEAVTHQTLPPADILKTALATAIADHAKTTSSAALAFEKPSLVLKDSDNAASEITTTCDTARRKRPRPELPAGLSWPMGDYGDSPEANGKGGDIVTYLEREWLDILDASRRDGRIYVDRRIIADWYPLVIIAIGNYRRPHPKTGKRREIPEKLRFPILKEVNDLIVASAPQAARIGASRATHARRRAPN